jgi:hypothetical protein
MSKSTDKNTLHAQDVALWRDITALEYKEVKDWTNNLIAYLQSGNRNKAQKKAALRRIENLKASLDGLAIAIKYGPEYEVEREPLSVLQAKAVVEGLDFE